MMRLLVTCFRNSSGMVASSSPRIKERIILLCWTCWNVAVLGKQGAPLLKPPLVQVVAKFGNSASDLSFVVHTPLLLLDSHGVRWRTDTAGPIYRRADKEHFVNLVLSAVVRQIVERPQFTECHAELPDQHAV